MCTLEDKGLKMPSLHKMPLHLNCPRDSVAVQMARKPENQRSVLNVHHPLSPTARRPERSHISRACRCPTDVSRGPLLPSPVLLAPALVGRGGRAPGALLSIHAARGAAPWSLGPRPGQVSPAEQLWPREAARAEELLAVFWMRPRPSTCGRSVQTGRAQNPTVRCPN